MLRLKKRVTSETREFLAELESPRDTSIEKSTQEFANIAVPKTVNTGGMPEVAAWSVDRKEYIKHFSGMTFVAVGAIAKKVAQQEAVVYVKRDGKSGRKLEPLDNHPLVDLFEEVNPIHTQFDLWYQMVAWRLVTGDSFWWKAKNGFNVPVELWPLPSQWVWAVPSREKFIAEYVVKSVFGGGTRLPAEDVLHIREPGIDWSGSGRFYGTPNLKAAASAVDLEEQMFNRLYHQFKNFAPPGLHYTTDHELSEQAFYDLLTQIRVQHKDTDRTGAPILSHSGLKASEFRQSVRELDYSNSLMTVMDYTMSVFGVPKAVVGLTKDFNRANTIGAMMSFVENTINPLLVHLGQHLTQGLAADFDEKLVVKFNPCAVNDRDALRRDIETASRAGAVTPNEVRDVLLRKKKFETGGDQAMLPPNLGLAPYGDGKIQTPVAPSRPAGGNGKPAVGGKGKPAVGGDGQGNIDDAIDGNLDVDVAGKTKDAALEVVAQFFRN